MLELVFRVCVRQRKKMGAGISGGGPPWAHEAGGRAQGVGCALHPRGQVAAPPMVFLHSKFSNIPEKIILNWHGILRTFIFGIFLYCADKSGSRQKYTILLYFY